MTKKILLKLKSIDYAGSRIGNDILLNLDISGKQFSFEQKIENKSTHEFNETVGEFHAIEDVFQASMKMKLIEKDPIFNDIGSIEVPIRIDTSNKFQIFGFEIGVKETRKIFFRAKAVFNIIFSAEVLEEETYVSKTESGWLIVKMDGKEISLPSFWQ